MSVFFWLGFGEVLLYSAAVFIVGYWWGMRRAYKLMTMKRVEVVFKHLK